MSKIAVIGAGISGVMAAYYLARDGHDVFIYEQEKYAGMRASYANGGQISVSNSEVWTTWKNVKKGIKWMFKKDAALLVRPGFEWKKISWLMKFCWHTFNNEYRANTSETIRLGLESRKLYQEIIKEENIEFDYSNCGILHFYKNEEYYKDAIDSKEIYEKNGCEWKILSTPELKSLDSSLEPITGIIGGAWTSDDSTGDIHKFCYNLLDILEKKHNVKFYSNTKIESIQNIIDDYDFIVISAGVESVNLAKQVGDNLPIYPVKGYSITIPLDEQSKIHAPKVSILDDQAKIVLSRLGDNLRIAGTAELDGENYDIRKDRIKPLLNWVNENFPQVNTNVYSSWACLRPMTPNMMPIVERSKKNSKVFYHTGHGHLGWTISPATAKQLLKIIS